MAKTLKAIFSEGKNIFAGVFPPFGRPAGKIPAYRAHAILAHKNQGAGTPSSREPFKKDLGGIRGGGRPQWRKN